MSWRRRSKPRPWWRTAGDAAIFLLVLAITLIGLQRYNVLDVGSGNATASDGDSLTLNNTSVRLHGIDALELHQTCWVPAGEYTCGRDARDALRALIRGRTISCTAIDGDRYGRAVSICRAGTLEINNEIVRLGWAVAYFRHSTAYARAQKEAKAAKRGIWQGKFELPENFRERTRNMRGGLDE